MAPLRFRAWHKAEKIMLPHVGRLGFGIGDKLASVDAGQTDNWIRDGYHTFRGTEELEMIVLMQSTGLHDKNGKEIFEGDWVIGEEFNNWKERGLVLWYRIWCGFGIDWDYMSNMPLVDNRRFGEQDNKLEVIGNIHEHPHVLPPQ